MKIIISENQLTNLFVRLLSEELNYDSVDGFIKIRDAALPFMTELVAKHYGDEIRAYYNQELNN